MTRWRCGRGVARQDGKAALAADTAAANSAGVVRGVRATTAWVAWNGERDGWMGNEKKGCGCGVACLSQVSSSYRVVHVDPVVGLGVEEPAVDEEFGAGLEGERGREGS